MSKNSLQDIIKSAEQSSGDKELPPVHLWNPPYCGDIGMRIARDGTWFYQDSPIGRKRLVRLFSTILRYDEDGCFYLVTPAEKILVTVEDAPFIATLMDVEGTGEAQKLHFTTNVNDHATAGATHRLSFHFADNDEPSPYVMIRANLQALIARPVFYELVNHAVVREIDNVEQFGVWSDGEFFPIAPADKVQVA